MLRVHRKIERLLLFYPGSTQWKWTSFRLRQGDAFERYRLCRSLFDWAVVLSNSFIRELAHAVHRCPSEQRIDLSVKSRSHWKVEVANIFSVTRQRQFPAEVPGTFIRLSVPRSNTSCKGAIVTAATEDHASSISAGAASALSTNRRLRQVHKVCLCESDDRSYHSRVG